MPSKAEGAEGESRAPTALSSASTIGIVCRTVGSKS